LLATAKSEPYKRLEIFERDGWICQLCEKRIWRSLKWPDKQAAVVDHIIPISLGGDDTSDNVQAAHLLCNSRKYNRLIITLKEVI